MRLSTRMSAPLMGVAQVLGIGVEPGSPMTTESSCDVPRGAARTKILAYRLPPRPEVAVGKVLVNRDRLPTLCARPVGGILHTPLGPRRRRGGWGITVCS